MFSTNQLQKKMGKIKKHSSRNKVISQLIEFTCNLHSCYNMIIY